MADNFKCTVKSELVDLEHILNFSLNDHKIEGLKIVEKNNDEHKIDSDMDDSYSIVLYWYVDNKNADIIKFPCKLDAASITPMIKQILKSAPYPKYPDIDGSCSKGFYLTTGEFWNHIEEYGHYSCILIKPCWLFHHK